ncbi:MAG: YbhB/YbcL family Raf kinase inhibitor-like protein [Deltaproteobacteria bacterium]|nr:YbhB/YbcL family Raf kinase inhibitor-like protein [Deltaproteobacteria bacterium]
MKQQKKRWCKIAVAALVLIAVAATAQSADFPLSSPAIEPGRTIPDAFTCKGMNISPPLSWSGTPKGTKSLALMVDDPDAPSGTFTHWIAWNIPAGSTRLLKGVSKNALPEKMAEGINDFHRPGYNGPCPPPGRIHHYRFTLYALDTLLDLPAQTTRAGLDDALTGHIIGTARFSALFSISR